MRDLPYTKHKLPEHHHDKKTVSYQKTKRHTTDKEIGRGWKNHLEA